MRRIVGPAVGVLVALAASCASDAVSLVRGPLGPASYEVELAVAGGPAVHAESVEAIMAVEEGDTGATLTLVVAGEDPVTAELRRAAGGRLDLESVQGVSPDSAGEADLASLVGQLDPPLPESPVRLGERWSATRRISTDILRASLRSDLRLIRFRRLGGTDAAQIAGDVSGTLRTDGPSGTFEGTVTGTTRIVWALRPGRVVASETELLWRIDGTGEIRLRSVVQPR